MVTDFAERGGSRRVASSMLPRHILLAGRHVMYTFTNKRKRVFISIFISVYSFIFCCCNICFSQPLIFWLPRGFRIKMMGDCPSFFIWRGGGVMGEEPECITPQHTIPYFKVSTNTFLRRIRHLGEILTVASSDVKEIRQSRVH